MNKVIQQGAEAVISLNNNQIIKNRIKKSYRIKEIDEKLRKSRTKSEAKIINKLKNIIPVPKIIKSDNKETIEMQYIEGKKLSDYLENLDYKKICKLIANNISKIHDSGIVHGDLTTSNMIYVEDDKNQIEDISLIKSKALNKNNFIINNIKNKITSELASKRSQRRRQFKAAERSEAAKQDKVYFIDFGLSFHSNKIEDKAVDLHLLQQALEAKHFTIWQDCWKIILDNYKAKDSELIKKRIKIIESRGRYKEKY